MKPILKRTHEKATELYFLLRALRMFGFYHIGYDVLASLFAGGNTSSLRNILDVLEEQGLLGIEKGESFKNSNGIRYFGPNIYYAEPFLVNLDPKSKARLKKKFGNRTQKSSNSYSYKVIRNHSIYRFDFILSIDIIESIVSVSIKKSLNSTIIQTGINQTVVSITGNANPSLSSLNVLSSNTNPGTSNPKIEDINVSNLNSEKLNTSLESGNPEIRDTEPSINSTYNNSILLSSGLLSQYIDTVKGGFLKIDIVDQKVRPSTVRPYIETLRWRYAELVPSPECDRWRPDMRDKFREDLSKPAEIANDGRLYHQFHKLSHSNHEIWLNGGCIDLSKRGNYVMFHDDYLTEAFDIRNSRLYCLYIMFKLGCETRKYNIPCAELIELKELCYRNKSYETIYEDRYHWAPNEQQREGVKRSFQTYLCSKRNKNIVYDYFQKHMPTIHRFIVGQKFLKMEGHRYGVNPLCYETTKLETRLMCQICNYLEEDCMIQALTVHDAVYVRRSDCTTDLKYKIESLFYEVVNLMSSAVSPLFR